jgi:hypothetical protein
MFGVIGMGVGGFFFFFLGDLRKGLRSTCEAKSLRKLAISAMGISAKACQCSGGNGNHHASINTLESLDSRNRSQ